MLRRVAPARYELKGNYSGVGGPSTSTGPDPFGILAAVQGGLIGVEAGLEVALGVALIGVALLLVLSQTSVGGAVGRAARKTAGAAAQLTPAGRAVGIARGARR